MRFEVTTDQDVIRAVITHPRLWDHLSDDYSPAPEDYRPLPHALYITAWDGRELLGLWMFESRNGVCLEVHTALLPRAWGQRGKQAAQELVQWIFTHTPCRRITTSVPAYNRLALKFARAAGFKEFGISPRSYQKRGILHDQVLLGVSKCQ